MNIETGVLFSIHGEYYFQNQKHELWRDFKYINGINAKNQFTATHLTTSALMEFIKHSVQKDVFDDTTFGKRTLEVCVKREPYIKITAQKMPDHKEQDKSFYFHGGETVFYINTAPQLIYPTNICKMLEIPQKETAFFLADNVPVARFYYPQTYGRFDESYKTQKCDIKQLSPDIPLRILDYYPHQTDWLTARSVYISQFKPTDVVVDYNLNQQYPIVKNEEEELKELKRLLSKKTEPIILNGIETHTR